MSLGLSLPKRQKPEIRIATDRETRKMGLKPKPSIDLDLDLEDRPAWSKKTAQVIMKKILSAKGEEITIPVRKFTDTTRLLEEGNHLLIMGTTGKGKTVLLYRLVLELYKHGYSVINRDDGGLESLLIAPLFEHTKDFYIWVPEGCSFRATNWTVPNRPFYFDPLKPKHLVQEILDIEGVHTILFDVYCAYGEATVKFWGPFYRQLIFQVQQLPTTQRIKRVLSADELHDIVQPHQHAITSAHAKARGMVELNIRKLRKFGFKLVCSVHRPTQLPINVRSQFAYFIFKKTFPSDAYNMLNQMMAHIPGRLFWAVVNDVVHALRLEEFYLFDDSGHFDKITNPDIPRWLDKLKPKERKKAKTGLKTMIKGSVDDLFATRDDTGEKIFDWKDLEIYLQRVPGTKYYGTYEQIMPTVELKKTTIHDRLKKIRRIDRLDDRLKGLAID